MALLPMRPEEAQARASASVLQRLPRLSLNILSSCRRLALSGTSPVPCPAICEVHRPFAAGVVLPALLLSRSDSQLRTLHHVSCRLASSSLACVALLVAICQVVSTLRCSQLCRHFRAVASSSSSHNSSSCACEAQQVNTWFATWHQGSTHALVHDANIPCSSVLPCYFTSLFKRVSVKFTSAPRGHIDTATAAVKLL